MKIVSREGVPLDAEFDVVPSPLASGAFEIILAARGDGRNKDYTEGLTQLLLRVAGAGGVLLDAVVDTAETQKKGLTQEERRLSPPGGVSFPVALRDHDMGALAAALKASQRPIGQAPSARGGNDTRRIVLTVQLPAPLTIAHVAGLLSERPPMGASGAEAEMLDGHRVFAIYVGRASQQNLEIGLQRGIWGFRDELMRGTRAATYEAMSPGDILVIGSVSSAPGGPRRPASEWRGHPFRQLVIGVIVDVHQAAAADVWPDDVYPWRVSFETEWEAHDLVVGDDLAEALRLSGVGAGAPIQVAAKPSASSAATTQPAPPVFPEGVPTDKIGTAVRRSEQTWLRRTLLDGRSVAPCALCDLEFPDWMLTAAHTKERNACSESERRDPNVGMLACPNCDSAFEKGAILVNGHGIIEVPGLPDQPNGLAAHVARLHGKACSAFNEDSETYFAHRYAANAAGVHSG